MHTDEPHPHVHMVVKAVSEQGERLNIRKATLRHWRQQFAEKLREQGVPANATERAVRGQSRLARSDRIFRVPRREASSYDHSRRGRRRSGDGPEESARDDRSRLKAERTRADVVRGWQGIAAILESSGDPVLADRTRRFVRQMAIHGSAGTSQRLAQVKCGGQGRLTRGIERGELRFSFGGSMSKSELKNLEPVLPTAEDVARAQKAVSALARESSGVSNVGFAIESDSRRFKVVLPDAAVQLLERMLDEIAQGDAVTLMPIPSELATEQAADLLNVSRPYLAALLKSNVLPSREVGTKRRIPLEQLLEYKRAEDASRLEVLNQLTREAQELGLGY